MTCPGCGAEYTLDVLIAHEGAREALIEAMGMNLPLGKRLMQYLSLFRPPQRQLTMDRVAKILKEISPDIKAAQITRHGRIWAIPLESWQWALDEIVAKKSKLNLPLKSHGYLYEMLIAAADKIEAGYEAKTEERRRGGGLATGQVSVTRTNAAPVATLIRTEMPQAAREAIDQMKIKNKGK